MEFQQPTTFTVPSLIVPGFGSASICSSEAAFTSVHPMIRRYNSFPPSPLNPQEYNDPRRWCSTEVVDTAFGPTYSLQITNKVSVSGPINRPQLNQVRPYWLFRVQIGSVNIWFRNTDGDFNCRPRVFALDTERTATNWSDFCHAPCGTCVVLNPPPPPQTYPGTGQAGSTFSHNVEVNIGSVQIG